MSVSLQRANTKEMTSFICKCAYDLFGEMSVFHTVHNLSLACEQMDNSRSLIWAKSFGLPAKWYKESNAKVSAVGGKSFKNEREIRGEVIHVTSQMSKNEQ